MRKKYPLLALLFITEISLAQFTKISANPPTLDGLDSHGVSWVDYDNDGDDDLFVTTASSPESIISKDQLYRNNGDGTFSKITSGPLVTEDGTGRNSTWADYDNDGFVDVFVSNQHETFLFKNEGDGEFTNIASVPTTAFATVSDHQGGAWGDYNNDGFVDLFLASYKLSDDARNALFTNNGDGTFTEVAETNIVTTRGYSQDPSWIDYDQNGTLDLFVPNYGDTPNYLYSNLGNEFQSISDQNINAVSTASLGASWADYDNDGDFDVLVPNNVNASNSFFENNGNGTFAYKPEKFGITLSSSASWADFDNDGFVDVMLTGGAGDKTYLFKNNGNKTFTDVSAAHGITDLSYSWAVASADYDQDGFIDFFIATANGNNRSADDILYHNKPNANHWVEIKLVGTITNRSAIGATIRVKTGNKLQSRTIQSKTGASAQNSLTAHFGVAQSTTIDRIIVEWPGKGFQEIADQAADEIITVTEIPFPDAPINALAVKENFDHVEISWTDNSTDETGFRIERSTNGSSFAELGEVASNVTSFTDNTVAPGNTYAYRVASLTTGGYSKFSKTETVIITGVEERGGERLAAYPNPVQDFLLIDSNEKVNYPIQILNSVGIVVRTISGPVPGEAISVENLPAGPYIVATGNYRIKVFKK